MHARIRHHRHPACARRRPPHGSRKPGSSFGRPASHVRSGPGPPVPSASPRRGSRWPRAARRNPNPRRPTLACNTAPDLTRASREPRRAALSHLPSRASQPVRRSRVPGPLGSAPPSPPYPPVPCGTLATPTVGLDPRTARIRRRRPSALTWASPQGSRPTVTKGKELPPFARLAPCFRRPLRSDAPTPSFPRRHPFGGGSCQWIAS